MKKTCTVVYLTHMYQQNGTFGKATFEAEDYYEVCQKLTQHLDIATVPEDFEEDGDYWLEKPEDRERLGEECLKFIIDSNGDCLQGEDFIFYLTFGDTVLHKDSSYMDNEKWD